MLYSFDIGGTLMPENAKPPNFKIFHSSLNEICKLILNGHIVLLNTSESSVIKSHFIISKIMQRTFENSKTKFCFSEEEQKTIVENFNKNFYTCLSTGTQLQKNFVPKYETLKSFSHEQFINSNYITAKDIYTKSIPTCELVKLRELLEMDALFGINLNTNKWGYVNSASTKIFPYERVYVPYRQKLPNMPRIFFATVYNDDYRLHTQPHSFVQDLAYLKKIVNENRIYVEPIFISKHGLFFDPAGYTKATPITFLSNELNLNEKQCFHFGNKQRDLIPTSVATSFLIKPECIKKQQLPQNTTVVNNTETAIRLATSTQNAKTKMP